MERSCLHSISVEIPITGEDFYRQLIAQFVYCTLGVKPVYEDLEDPHAIMVHCTDQERRVIIELADKEIRAIVERNIVHSLDYLFNNGYYVTNAEPILKMSKVIRRVG